MAEVDLFTDGTTSATDADIIKARSKLYKNEWQSDVLNDGNHTVLKAIRDRDNDEGSFGASASDDGEEGEFELVFRYDANAGAPQDAKDMLAALMALCLAIPDARLSNEIPIGKVYVTGAVATQWADAAETALARAQ